MKVTSFDADVLLHAFDTATGELLYKEKVSSADIQIITKEDKDKKRFFTINNKLNKERFAKIMENAILILTKTLSSNALKIALRLICYMRYEDNCLIKSNGKKVFQKDMQVEFNYSKPTMEKYLKELMENGIVAKQKCDLGYCWFFNPFIARKGKETALETIKMFQNTKWNTQGIKV